jgi:lipoprotein signal peptidase
MITFALGLVLVPLLDQGTKRWLQRRLGNRSLSLGPLGSVKMVKSQIWLTRICGRPVKLAMGCLWLASAVALMLWCTEAPASAGFAGLLLGGSLSHGVESACSDHVIDYVCLRFWPAFDLSDAAMSIGAIGLLVSGCQILLHHAP